MHDVILGLGVFLGSALVSGVVSFVVCRWAFRKPTEPTEPTAETLYRYLARNKRKGIR